MQSPKFNKLSQNRDLLDNLFCAAEFGNGPLQRNVTKISEGKYLVRKTVA